VLVSFLLLGLSEFKRKETFIWAHGFGGFSLSVGSWHGASACGDIVEKTLISWCSQETNEGLEFQLPPLPPHAAISPASHYSHKDRTSPNSAAGGCQALNTWAFGGGGHLLYKTPQHLVY
jgi:hypothetical protein